MTTTDSGSVKDMQVYIVCMYTEVLSNMPQPGTWNGHELLVDDASGNAAGQVADRKAKECEQAVHMLSEALTAEAQEPGMDLQT